MSVQTTRLIGDLRVRLARMAAKVQQGVEGAAQSVLAHDAVLAQETVRADKFIDADEVEVERAAIELLAQHHPVAADLRLVTSVIKINGDLERIGDCAVNIAQRVPYLAQAQDRALPEDLRVMCRQVIETLRGAINAFNLSDLSLAQRTIDEEDVIDALYHQVVHDMIASFGGAAGGADKAGRDLAIVMIAKNLERIGDHCRNIADDTVYLVRGEIIRHAGPPDPTAKA